MNGTTTFTSTPSYVTTNFTKNYTTDEASQHNVTAALIIALLAGLLAFENYLLIFAVSINRLKRVPEILIFWLALSSLMNCFTLIIVAYNRAYDNDGREGINTLCKAQFWFATTLRTNDICTTTLMSIDRYVAITRPFLYRSKVRVEFGWVSVISSFVVSGIISCLPFAGFGSISRIVPSICVAKWDSHVSILIVGIAYIQFFIVLLSYIGIFYSIKSLVKRQKAMAKSQEITYDSPSMNSRSRAHVSTSASFETSSTSMDCHPQGDADRPVSLRVKAVLNRTQSNYEGAQSETFGLSQTELGPATSQMVRSSISLQSNTTLLTVVGDACGRPSSIPAQQHATSKDSRAMSRKGSLPDNTILPLAQENGRYPNERNSLKPGIYKHLNSIRDRLYGSFIRKRQASVKRQWRESEHFAKVMGAIVLLFYLSWLPLAVSITHDSLLLIQRQIVLRFGQHLRISPIVLLRSLSDVSYSNERGTGSFNVLRLYFSFAMQF